MPRTASRQPAPPATVPITLHERFGATETTVDRDACVIRDVKVCGLQSDNGRSYSRPVLAAARRLSEGVTVYTDHPPRPGQTRGTREAFGILRGVRDEPDGLRADLHYLPKHTLTEDVLSDVERRLGIFGLSHNVDARVQEQPGGLAQVLEIVKVRSVDLVTDPATNKNLWESRRMATTLKQIIEGSKLAKAAKKALLEMEGMGDTLAAPVEDPEPESDGRKLAAQAVAALIQSDDPDDHDLGTKIMKLLKPDAQGEEDPLEEDEEGEDETPASPKSEGRRPSRAAAGTVPLTEGRLKALCKLAGVEATPTVLAACQGGSENSVLAILELAKTARTSGRGGSPRSSTPGTASVTESKTQLPPEDSAKLAGWLNSR